MNRSVGGSRRDGASPDRIEGLARGPDARRPFEPHQGHDHSNGHYALLYETPEEQFAAVVPFVRDGLEAGEQVFYIVGERSRETVLAALREDGIDVDAALESGQLSLHTVADTYLDGGEFDVDEARALLEAAMEVATAEYGGFRVTAEETWLLEQGTTTHSEFADCEAHVNDLLEGEDCLALCQYDRSRLPSDVVDDVLDTHPHLVYDGTVCENPYYTPPVEYFDPDSPSNEVDRKLETLADRTRARRTLQTRERYQSEVYEAVSSTGRTFEEKLQALFQVGCERFGFELGGLARVDPDSDLFEVEATSGEHEHLAPGVELDLSDTYCRVPAECEPDAPGAVPDPVEITDPASAGFVDEPCVTRFGVHSYLGTRVPVDGGVDRTFFFVASEEREEPVTPEERSFLRSMAQWVKYELERRQRERHLRESYEITSDPALSFEEKLERLLDLGRERFDLDMAGLNRLESSAEGFRIETAVGFDADDVPSGNPGDPYFCRSAIDEDAPVGRHDVRGTEWESDWIHREFGLTSYIGTKVVSGSTTYGTLWLGSREPRDRPFSDSERTFLDLVGQWVGYELERQQWERDLEATIDQLEQSNDRLKQFAYAASHDLQEPLRMVSSYLQLLEKQYGSELDGDAEEYIEFAVDGADRMRAMVDDLLAFSRVEQADAALEPVDCEAVLERVRADHSVQIEEHGAEVVVDSLPTVRGATEQLEQLFGNLLSNAIKYNDSDPPRVEITAEERGDDWEFAVADNGIGIDPDSTDRIFEVFKRLHHDDEYPGTGVGLSLCQKIVSNHGGDIWVESEPGEGSTFYVTLPKYSSD